MNGRYTRRYGIAAVAVGAALAALATAAPAQQSPAAGDADYMAKIMTAAPAPIAQGATVVTMDKGGAMRTVQKGTNAFTCMVIPDGTPMCADQNAWMWMTAMMGNKAPPNAIGFVYMLAGDSGASNTDPTATAATPQNHWIKTGPHVMIVGPGSKTLGYPRTADADPTKPYVMWAGTPYEHVMIPVK